MEHQTNIDQLKLHNGAKNYSTFIYSFTTFLLHYFEQHSLKMNSNKEKLISEQLVSESLFLLEKLHMHLFYSFCIYEKHYTQLKHPLKSNENFNRLNKLKEKIKKHPFLSEENRTLCEKIITQILNYYPQSSNQIKIILTPISPPWIADL